MTLFAVLLAGVAAVLWFPTPRRPWSRSPDLQLPAWLRPRDDALPGRLRWAVGAGAGMVAFLLADSLGVFAVLVAGGVGAGVAVGLGHVEPPSVQRQREQRIRDLPEVLDLLGACLAAGMPLRRAAREVAAVSQGPIG
ncbi:MAG: hypothetical protein Q4G46_02105, partial [Propionibacteriaceae bacterium]|nr:hypothetical protein [Propionibacteriaceae bacterium]